MKQKFYPVGRRSFSFGAFTLIELLVVIAIIGLLASIVLVSLRSARGKATTAAGLQFSQSVFNSLGSEAVGIWDFDEGTGITAGDRSGDKNNGTITGASWSSEGDTPSKKGYALYFNGTTGDYVSIPNLNLTKSFTLEAWINPKNTGGFRTIMGYAGTRRWLISPSNLMLVQFEGNFLSINIVPNDTWSHVVYTFNETEGKEKYYINGKLDSEHSATTPSWSSSFFIGQYDKVNYPYKGSIDNVRVYGVALSAGEIQKHYAEGLKKHNLAEK